MLVMLSPIFVADTRIIIGYNFVALLRLKVSEKVIIGHVNINFLRTNSELLTICWWFPKRDPILDFQTPNFTSNLTGNHTNLTRGIILYVKEINKLINPSCINHCKICILLEFLLGNKKGG